MTGLSATLRVLVVNTEEATDPVPSQLIVGRAPAGIAAEGAA